MKWFECECGAIHKETIWSPDKHECIDCYPTRMKEVEGNYQDYRKKRKAYEKRFTCYECPSNKECEFAWDGYNTQGDCLWMK